MSEIKLTYTGAEVQALLDKSNAYPKPSDGIAGQAAVSDGAGGIAWKDAIMPSLTVTIPSSGWAASSTHTGYYENAVSVTSVKDEHPEWGISDSTGSGIPTAEQITAFEKILVMIADKTANTLTFYAAAAQTADVYALVKGVS
jgi:hypothetical protein